MASSEANSACSFHWDAAQPQEQHFALITGTNSGVGLAIGERLMDEFLLTRSLTSHLVLIATTRSEAKSRDTIVALRRHLERNVHSARFRQALLGRQPVNSRGYNPGAVIQRVHILSTQLDLCDLASIHTTAAALMRCGISNPQNIPATDYQGGYPEYKYVVIPRLDTVILNAGMGGWTSLDWLAMARMAMRAGISETLTFPDYKIAAVGSTTPGLRNPRRTHVTSSRESNSSALSSSNTAVPSQKTNTAVLGQVFMANVFGHYVFVHELLPLLMRNDASGLPQARIIWQSSIEAMGHHLDPSDIQALRSTWPYESTKRLTDVLVLTAELPSVRPVSRRYLSLRANGEDRDPVKLPSPIPPKMYVAHPGIVVTTIFPLPWLLRVGYLLFMYLARLIGSPWHTVTSYLGAVSCVWLALESDLTLQGMEAERSKWGSACNRWGKARCKRSEVTGWGWDGRVLETHHSTSNNHHHDVLEQALGRWSGSKDTTIEDIHNFELLGAACWSEMENLRLEWDHIYQRAAQDANLQTIG